MPVISVQDKKFPCVLNAGLNSDARNRNCNRAASVQFPEFLLFEITIEKPKLLPYLALMARVTVEDCLTPCPNRFALVHLAAKRTKQLMKGSRPLIENPGNKPAVLALREIAELRVRLPHGWTVVDVDKPADAILPPDQRED